MRRLAVCGCCCCVQVRRVPSRPVLATSARTVSCASIDVLLVLLVLLIEGEVREGDDLAVAFHGKLVLCMDCVLCW